MSLGRVVFFGGAALAAGRAFSAGRELWLAHDLGPTDQLSEYVMASTIFLAVGGLLSGVASALMIREGGRGRHVMPVALAASLVCLLAFGIFVAVAGDTLRDPLSIWCLALMMPLFAAYGVANGALIREGRVAVGMVAASLQPLVSVIVMLLPWPHLTQGASCGNLAGAVVMVSVVFHFAYRSGPAAYFNLKRSTLLEGAAIVAVSAANIASPIIDRIFASSLGNSSLVLLNLSTIAFAAITGTLGLALGNAAVAQSFRSTEDVKLKVPLVLGLICALLLAFSSIPASWYIESRDDYSASSGSAISNLLLIFALAIPVALINQVWIRVWNKGASVREMLTLAGMLLGINALGNFVFIHFFDVAGIAISTVLTQLVQCLYLGMKWQQTSRAVGLVFGTIVLGVVVGGVVIV
ncbi:hypothetical protein ACIPY1_10870 [Paenarthrobacter nicotinovorans]|uniref:hypothetical protein n=1 Tax=Paenarthrobacter nicotinovorans TaxID=29320 RepID=UPI00381769D6